MDYILRRGSPIQISVPAPSRLPHVRGRGTADPPHAASSRGAQTESHGTHSSHTCIGDMSTVKPRAHRACLFERICLDTKSLEFLYYRDPSQTQPPVLFDRRYGHLFAFGHVSPKGGREDLLPLNKHVRYKRHVRWSPRIVDGAIPRGAPLLTPLHLLSTPFVPTNLGHLAWEEAFPLLLAMVQLGAYAPSESTVVLRTHACNESIAARSSSGGGGAGGEVGEAPTPSEARLCGKFLDGFMRPVGSVETIRAVAARHAAAGHRTICFSRVVAGGFYDMFNTPSHAGKEPWLQLYRQRVLAYHRLAPQHGWPPPPRAHKLLVVRKEGRRGIANFNAVLTFLQGGCSGMCEGIDAVVPVAFQTMSIREQLALISSCTIAFSPPGGASMVLPFLPEGAHAILINYMLSERPSGTERHGGADEARCTRCSLTMEASLWNHMRHVRPLYYQVWEPSDFARRQPGRDAAVIVQMPRLGYLVRIALDAMARGAR